MFIWDYLIMNENSENQEVKILSKKEIKERLVNFSGWKFTDNKISKEFKFDDFMDSLSFVNDLAPFCESIDHHPDVHIFYSKIVFELQRFDIGGKVTDRDFIVAAEIERLYAL